MSMTENSCRARLRRSAAAYYEPAELAEAILACLPFIEVASATPLPDSPYRRRTGLTCLPEHVSMTSHGAVEDAITGYVARCFPNAESQTTDFAPGCRPDILFGFSRDGRGDDIAVVVEAKPVWHRWISDGRSTSAGVTTDEHGRSTGNYAAKNIGQVVGDRDKLTAKYTDQRDRHLLLALVFQRPGELDEQLIEAVGPGWEHRKRHVVDRNAPSDDEIGVTGVVWWPAA